MTGLKARLTRRPAPARRIPNYTIKHTADGWTARITSPGITAEFGFNTDGFTFNFHAAATGE